MVRSRCREHTAGPLALSWAKGEWRGRRCARFTPLFTSKSSMLGRERSSVPDPERRTFGPLTAEQAASETNLTLVARKKRESAGTPQRTGGRHAQRREPIPSSATRPREAAPRHCSDCRPPGRPARPRCDPAGPGASAPPRLPRSPRATPATEQAEQRKLNLPGPHFEEMGARRTSGGGTSRGFAAPKQAAGGFASWGGTCVRVDDRR